MDSETYWAQRAEQRERLWNKKAKSTIEKELAEYYRQAFNAIEEDIAALYGRFAKDNKLSYSEAVKLLTGSEYRQWRMSMEQYLAEIKDEKDPLLTELNTLAMRKRISRLDKLRAETLKELRKLAGRADLNVEKFLGDAYKDNYYKSLYDIGQKASILSSVAEVDSEKLKEVLSAPWSGRNYSQRLWKNTDKLSRLIKQEITDGIHRGTSLQKLASLIRQRMDVGQYEAMRLVRTEMNYAQNHAALDSIKDSGMKYYTFIATLDKRTSAICRAHDRKTYPASEAQPGKNMPPLHPNCRSTISGSLKSTGRNKGTRSGRDAEGNRITVPASMAYEDFKKIYIDKSMTLQDWEKAQQKSPKDDIIKIKQDLMANTSILKGSMKEDDYKEYINLLAKNDAVRDVYINYADNIRSIRRVSDGGVYRPSQNELEWDFVEDRYVKAGQSKFSTLAHEYGHFFDARAKYEDLAFSEVDGLQEAIQKKLPGYKFLDRIASSSDEFLQAMRQDKEHLKKILSPEIRLALGQDDASAGVQDAIDGLFVKSRIAWGHGESYYNRKYTYLKNFDGHKILKEFYLKKKFDASNQSKVKEICRVYEAASEAWANIVSAITNSGKELEYVQKYLPNSYQKCLDILKRVQKNDDGTNQSAK